MTTRVCPRCPTETATKPLDVRFWNKHRNNREGFDTICRACHCARSRAARNAARGGAPSLAQRLVPGIPTPSIWISPRNHREVRFRVDNINPQSGIRASGTIGRQRITVMATWLIEHGTRVTEEAAE